MPPVRRRYILFRIEPTYSKESFSTNEGEIVNTVRQTIQQVHGDFGLASVLLNFHCKRYHAGTRTGVLSVKRESYRFLITTIPLIRAIRDQPVNLTILKLSGTIRGCLRSLQGYHGKAIAQYKKLLKNRKANGNGKDGIAMINEGFEQIKQSLKE